MDSSTKKAFIQRDFRYGTSVRFSTDLPRELIDKVDQDTFENTMNHINSIFESAERLSTRNIMEGCLSCLTGYTLHYCFKMHYEQCVDQVARYINQQNHDVYQSRGVVIGDPMDRGLRCIEVSFSKEVESRA